MHFLIKLDFFSEMKKLTVGKIFDLYTTDRALLNLQCKFALYSLLFFSIFCGKSYNMSAIQSTTPTHPRFGSRKTRPDLISAVYPLFY
jgi:hypothetical protein